MSERIKTNLKGSDKVKLSYNGRNVEMTIDDFLEYVEANSSGGGGSSISGTIYATAAATQIVCPLNTINSLSGGFSVSSGVITVDNAGAYEIIVNGQVDVFSEMELYDNTNATVLKSYTSPIGGGHFPPIEIELEAGHQISLREKDGNGTIVWVGEPLGAVSQTNYIRLTKIG